MSRGPRGPGGRKCPECQRSFVSMTLLYSHGCPIQASHSDEVNEAVNYFDWGIYQAININKSQEAPTPMNINIDHIMRSNPQLVTSSQVDMQQQQVVTIQNNTENEVTEPIEPTIVIESESSSDDDDGDDDDAGNISHTGTNHLLRNNINISHSGGKNGITIGVSASESQQMGVIGSIDGKQIDAIPYSISNFTQSEIGYTCHHCGLNGPTFVSEEYLLQHQITNHRHMLERDRILQVTALKDSTDTDITKQVDDDVGKTNMKVHITGIRKNTSQEVNLQSENEHVGKIQYAISNYTKSKSGFTCHHCGPQGPTFRTSGLLRMHQKTQHRSVSGSITSLTDDDKHRNHPNRPDKVVCSLCGEKVSKWYLKNHMDYHRGRKFICTDCGAEFPYRRALQRHRIKFKHQADKIMEATHQCVFSTCGAKFTLETRLNKHYQSKHFNNMDSTQILQQPQKEEEQQVNSIITSPPCVSSHPINIPNDHSEGSSSEETEDNTSTDTTQTTHSDCILNTVNDICTIAEIHSTANQSEEQEVRNFENLLKLENIKCCEYTCQFYPRSYNSAMVFHDSKCTTQHIEAKQIFLTVNYRDMKMNKALSIIIINANDKDSPTKEMCSRYLNVFENAINNKVTLNRSENVIELEVQEIEEGNQSGKRLLEMVLKHPTEVPLGNQSEKGSAIMIGSDPVVNDTYTCKHCNQVDLFHCFKRYPSRYLLHSLECTANKSAEKTSTVTMVTSMN